MKTTCAIFMMITATTLADIGEKLRLGLSVKSVPQKNFNSGLQAPFSTSHIGDNKAEATSHSDNDEDNLDRLCNDPFHSFLCKPVGPRKNRIDGRLRPGAKIPPNVITSDTKLQESKQPPTRSGGGLLSLAIQPSSSFDSPSISAFNRNNGYLPPEIQQPSSTQQLLTRPSNQYLPSNSDPVPVSENNVQLTAPLQQPQQNVYRYTVPPVRPNQNIIIQNRQQTQFIRPTTPPPTRQTIRPATKQILSTTTKAPIPNNRYLPVEENIDIRISPSSTNLSPSLQGSAILSQGRQALSKTNQPKKEERQHTLEELCNDAFHSFLCKPVTKPRKRIDGRIRPGAKIPANVLQGAGTTGSGAIKFPAQQTGTALLSEGRENQKTAQGYYYPKPQNIPSFAFQATNQRPVQNVLIYNQKSTPDKVPERIPPPNPSKYQPQNNFPAKNQLLQNTKPQNIPFQPSNQQRFQNVLVSNQKATPDKVPARIPPPSSSKYQPQINFQANNQLAQKTKPESVPFVFQATNQQSVQKILEPNPNRVPDRIPPPSTSVNQLQNKVPIRNQLQTQSYNINSNKIVTTTPKPINNSPQQLNAFLPSNPLSTFCTSNYLYFTSLNTPKPNQFIQVNPNKNENYYPNPTAESAQISSQSIPFNNPNQFTSNGYKYSTPFTYPTTTVRPTTAASNIFYIPPNNDRTKLTSSQNQFIITTQRPVTIFKPISNTNGYDYQTPSSLFTLPTLTQNAISTNNQPVVISTVKLPETNGGYLYLKPAQPFTLPTTTSGPITGYNYPKPIKAFTLPPRNQLSNGQEFGNRLSQVQTFNEQFSYVINNGINDNLNKDDTLPPASQFEILKP